MELRLVACFLAVPLVATGAANEETVPLPLSSLRQGCEIVNGALGEFSPLDGPSRGAWLQCGDFRALLVGPLSLRGNVRITNPAQALELARFFTSWRSCPLFELDPPGMIEVKGAADGDFITVSEDVFKRHLAPPRVKPDTPCVSRRHVACDYVVTRSVAAEDGRVYEISEQVLEDGAYHLMEKRIIARDAKKLGIYYTSCHR